ncbi:MAG: hypothetical protein CMA64_10575 [Euryarchaeota archaeon]|nr:hypothetical protein [Euryarchaeota archaeon]|tara:strand:- start:6966 stop:7580 length:615 start_codon:yes stop_codon:yes gene_type:complete
MIDKNHHTSYKDFLRPTECHVLSYLAIDEEDSVMSIDNPFRHTNAYTGLTGQHMVYNWLSHPTVASMNIPQRLFELPDFADTTHIAIQCWMNILRQEERLAPHTHGEPEDSPSYAINIFLSGNTTTGTRYEDTGYVHNEIGEIHICSNQMEHSVPSQLFPEPRVSMAMDVWIDDESIEEIYNSTSTFPNSEVRVIEFRKNNDSI